MLTLPFDLPEDLDGFLQHNIFLLSAHHFTELQNRIFLKKIYQTTL